MSLLSSIKTPGKPPLSSSITAILPSFRLSPSSHISSNSLHFQTTPFFNSITTASL
ncbi:hypothetical protein HanIR_Chr04g0185111 [Helianthus annuus]|nr:hypothetical protein HanIR_Chr04g0185111 [Helianthus annuus]